MQHHPKLQDFEMYVYKCLEKYCSVAKPFRSNYRSLDPIYGFYFDCADFPNQKRNEKRWDVRKKKKKKKSVILAPLFFPTWSNRRMRDRDKLVERRTGELCWEIKLVTFVQCPALCWQDCRCWCSKKKKKKKKGNCPALSGSATVFSCSWLRHHRYFYSPFPFAARALHVESALC